MTRTARTRTDRAFIVFFILATIVAGVGTVAAYRSDADVTASILGTGVTVFFAVCVVILWIPPRKP